MPATRTNEKLENLPNAISVMTADLLADLGALNFLDAADFAVGAENVFNDGATRGAAVGARSGNTITFRGLASVRQLRDGFPWFLPADTYNTERIEFSRGPGGLAYGDVDPTGIINVSTKRATFRRSASATVRMDSFGTQRYSVDVNQPLLPRLGLRFVADIDDLGMHLVAMALQLLGSGGILGRVRAPDTDIGASLRQRLGHAEADAAVATGDQRHLARQIEALVGHASFPPGSTGAGYDPVALSSSIQGLGHCPA